MYTLDDILERWIPYRLQAVETLQFAWLWAAESDEPREVTVHVDGNLKIKGNVAAVANPMIEAGIIHARALLEFMGLCASKGRLAQIIKRRKDDVAIEHYSTAQFPLCHVKLEEALAAYAGPAHEAETALLAIFDLANKGHAHLTLCAPSTNYTDDHIDIACRGIPVLLNNHLYAKLGRKIPEPPSAVLNGGQPIISAGRLRRPLNSHD